MNWTELITFSLENAYKSTEGLLDLVDEDKLDWKPATGTNWMTVGQLLKHLSESCGAGFRGFVTGDWGMPDDLDFDNLTPEEMLPPAEAMATVESVAEAKRLLKADKDLAYEMLSQCTEEQLATQLTPVPWDSEKLLLGHRLLQMVMHLTSHKHQLFYYLKLMGTLVHTGHLWGM